MIISRTSIRLVQTVIFLLIVYIAVQLAIYWGIEQKSWWQRSWEFVTGGTFGAITGAAFFIAVGAIGWVSGPMFGALGLISLMAGGAIGGMGLGALVHIARDPSAFNIHMPIVFTTLTIGAALALGLAYVVGRKLEQFAAARAKRVAVLRRDA